MPVSRPSGTPKKYAADHRQFDGASRFPHLAGLAMTLHFIVESITV